MFCDPTGTNAVSAEADFSAVIAADPRRADAYERRGYVRYDTRSWSDALADFREACRLEPQSGNLQLRIWLLRARIGEREAADRDLKALCERMKVPGELPWIGRLAYFLVGDVSEEQLLDAAGTEEHRCAAYFYAGARRLILGDANGARTLLRLCVATDARKRMEHRSANAELAALLRENE